MATDDLPEPDRPVNHTVLPLDSRSSAVTSFWCRTVLGLAARAARRREDHARRDGAVGVGSIRMNEPVAALRLYSSSSNGTWVRSVMRPSSLSFNAVALLSRCSVLTSSR